MPIHAVPKPHSTDLRMLTDQSASKFSLNSMIVRDDIKGYPLDNMKDLAEECQNMLTPHFLHFRFFSCFISIITQADSIW